MEFQIKNVSPLEVEPCDFTIQWDKIGSVYKGRLNACSCGCEGNYLYTHHKVIKTMWDTGNFLNNNNIKYLRSNDEFIFEVETERYMKTDNKGWEEEIVKGFRIYQKFKPFKIK